MGCKPSNVYFVSTATEGLAWALNSMYMAGVEAIVSPYEHHSVSENRKELISRVKCGCSMLVNNETGDIYSKPNGVDYWLCDATAAVGHMKVEFNSDVLVADGLKFSGVPGAAFVLAREDVLLTPLFRGGGQERGMRAGTENVPAIAAMAVALKWQCENMERNLLHVTRLRAEMLNRLKGTDYLVNAMGETSPYILNVSFMGVENGPLALMLSNRGVMVSTGAACTTGDNAPSHVLMAMYGDEERARSAIRISFSHDTTEDEVRIAASEIVECVGILKGMM
jgi:cysteine desulfurase